MPKPAFLRYLRSTFNNVPVYCYVNVHEIAAVTKPGTYCEIQLRGTMISLITVEESIDDLMYRVYEAIRLSYVP